MNKRPLDIPLNCRATGPFSALRLERIGPDLWRHLDRFEYRPPAPLPGPVVAAADAVTDLDSVPRLPLAYWLAKGRTVKGAAAHDALYRNGRLWSEGPKVTRRVADRIFVAAMRDEGVRIRHRWPIWLMVRAFGWRGWNRYRRAEARA